ncbi:MAG: hypothetical protein JW889_11775 [Verrucomicrobia bacterium]|nr:hypothetical protein [Verrucomicrobiota bacterium]
MNQTGPMRPRPIALTRKRTPRRRLLLFSVGGALVVVLALSAFFYGRAKRAGSGALYTVREGTLRIVITEDGTLEAQESEKVVADIEAQAKIVWVIDQGTFVTKGTKLVELDKTQLEDVLESLDLDLITLEANYESAKGRLNVLKAEGPQQLAKLKFEIEKATARRDKAMAQKPAQDKAHLYSASELRDAQIAVDEAKMSLASAELALDLYENYTHPQNLSEAAAELERSERIYMSKREKHKTVTEQLEKMELVAPSDGLVIYGDPAGSRRRWDSQEEEIKVGANVFKGQVVITLPNVTKMQVGIKIHEMDFLKVQKGQPAVIRVHAFPDEEFTGSIDSIGVLAYERDSWRSQGVKVFDAVVKIDGAQRRLRPGMMARVDVRVAEVPNVLLVPVEAVFVEPGKNETSCYVKTASGPDRRPVKLGQSNNTYVIVLEGLKEGDVIYQYDPTTKID